jgi:proline iminopeptidase
MNLFFNILLLITLSITANGQTFLDSESDGKFYIINGTKIWTVSFGNGEPLFLIAGGPGNAHSYLRGFDSLSTTNTLVYFDGFGRGKSDTANIVTEYTLERDISDLEE